jgi:inhibitor of cysteine peptidase
MKKLGLIVIVAATAALLCYLAMPTASQAEQSANASHNQEVQVGKQFRITLESNQTTGYRWQLARPLDQGVVKLVSSRYIGPAKQIPGAGGKEVWVFKAVGRGKTRIHLEYVRPWEKGEAPVKTASYSVVVR